MTLLPKPDAPEPKDKNSPSVIRNFFGCSADLRRPRYSARSRAILAPLANVLPRYSRRPASMDAATTRSMTALSFPE